jgi:hypothetical protein
MSHHRQAEARPLAKGTGRGRLGGPLAYCAPAVVEEPTDRVETVIDCEAVVSGIGDSRGRFSASHVSTEGGSP